MRVVAQNVKSSILRIDGEIVSQIGRGVLLLVGFCKEDDESVVNMMVNKIINERVFQDDNGLTNLSLNDIEGEVMSVSQFTLYADLKKGLRPSFINAKPFNEAKALYDYFNERLKALVDSRLKLGVFGADMKIELINDGPFTIVYDSEELF